MSAAAHPVRDAKLQELEALEALHRRAAYAWEEYRAALMAHADAIALPADAVREGRVRVVEHAGAARGFSVVEAVGERGVCELDGLFVEPACWHEGIGRTLVEDACARARGEGASAMEVTANPNALGFYEKLAFSRIGEVQTRFGPGVRMRRELS